MNLSQKLQKGLRYLETRQNQLARLQEKQQLKTIGKMLKIEYPKYKIRCCISKK